MQAQIEDGCLTEIEIENVSREVESQLVDLVKVMEMEYSFNEAVNSYDSTGGVAYAVIYDFTHIEGDTRYELAHHMRLINCTNASRR